MIDEKKAKGLLNYIKTANLSMNYEIISFPDIDPITSEQWHQFVKEFQNCDNIIAEVKETHPGLCTHIYKKTRNVPSSLRKMGHMLNINDPNVSFFCGREKEIHKIHIISHKRIKNNVLIVGDSGVGKTSLVMAYANRFKLDNIFVVECAKLISNTEYRGAFEQRVVELMEFSKGMKLILFFDEIHTLLNLGKTMGGISITDILKPYLLDYKIRFIGATTLKEANYLLMDEAFKRRFTTLVLKEPSEEILMQIKENFEHKIAGRPLLDRGDAQKVISVLKERLPQQPFPDKFVDYLDYVNAVRSIEGENTDYITLLNEYIQDQEEDISSTILF